MPFVWLRCRACQGGLFTDEGQRGTCGVCFRKAALRLDWLFALAGLNTPRRGVVRRVMMLQEAARGRRPPPLTLVR